MMLAWLLCALGFASGAGSQETLISADIRAGRSALEAGHPQEARQHFSAALGYPEATNDDRFAALIGLGRADIWLGQFRAAETVFRSAHALVDSPADRCVADTGLARALNSLEHYADAIALVVPCASGNLQATVELLRAASALGLVDKAEPYIAASPPVTPTTHLGAEFLRLKSDATFQLSNRAEGDFLYSHDSDGLTVQTYSLGAWLPGQTAGRYFNTWHVSAGTSSVSDGQQSEHVNEVGAGSTARLGDSQHLNLFVGAASVSGWDFVQGTLEWEATLNDTAAVNASIERSPIMTTTALDDKVLFSTYSLGASFRASDHLYLVPTYFHQEFSDGNHRDGGAFRLVVSPYDLPNTTTALGAEIYVRAYDSSMPTSGIYFNPASYRQEQVSLIAVHQFGPNWRLRAVAGIGPEAIDGSSAQSYAWDVSLRGRLPGNGRIEAHVGRNSFASMAGGGPGYWNNTATVSVVYPF